MLDDRDPEGGKVVLIRGEAGIGKTALVREFLARSSEAAHVLVGACDDLLTARPLGPFRDMSRDEPSLVDPLDAGNAAAVLYGRSGSRVSGGWFAWSEAGLGGWRFD